MDLTASPVSVCTASGSLRVAICTGGVSAGSFCEECATAFSMIDSDRSEPVVPAAVVTIPASEVPVLLIAVDCGASADSVLAPTDFGFGG